MSRCNNHVNTKIGTVWAGKEAVRRIKTDNHKAKFAS